MTPPDPRDAGFNAMSGTEFDQRARMVSSTRQHAFDACAAICHQIMDEENANAKNDPPGDINMHALRWSRYGTAKQILERIAALPSE